MSAIGITPFIRVDASPIEHSTGRLRTGNRSGEGVLFGALAIHVVISFCEIDRTERLVAQAHDRFESGDVRRPEPAHSRACGVVMAARITAPLGAPARRA